MEYKVISTDDHLQEGPDCWQSRMSKTKWGDKIPQVMDNNDGSQSWYIYGLKNGGNSGSGSLGSVNGALRGTKHWGGPTRWEHIPKNTYIPTERIKAMDMDGVDVHTFFANVGGVAGNTFNAPIFESMHLPNDFRLECIRAYNDMQIEEWATPYPGRFITLAVVPLWSVEQAVLEAQRAAKLGFNGLSFCLPQQWGYTHMVDEAWDPFWAVAEEAGMSINLHIGSGGAQGYTPAPTHEAQHRFLQYAHISSRSVSSNFEVGSAILFSLIPERFPNLKFVSSESGVGWVVQLLELSDHHWERMDLKSAGMRLLPSEYFHRQCYVNFFYEVVGLRLRENIGIGNIMWESDFPHTTCTWPQSQAFIQRTTAEMTEGERRKVLVENAMRVYNLK